MWQYEYPVVPGLKIVSKRRWSLWTVGVAIVMIFGVIVLATMGGMSPTHIVQEMQQARNAGVTGRVRAINTRSFSWPGPRVSDARRGSTPLSGLSQGLHGRQQQQRPQFIPTRFRRKRLTKHQKEIVLHRQRYRCARCHQQVPEWARDFDHRVGLCADPYGLHTERLNSLENFQMLCPTCHRWVTHQERQAGLHRRPTL